MVGIRRATPVTAQCFRQYEVLNNVAEVSVTPEVVHGM